MGRLRRRLAARSSAALETPFSWMFLISLFALVLIWRTYATYIWTTASCAEAVAWTFGPSRYDIAVIDLFTLAFLACAIVWFFNAMRFRTVNQSWTRRALELGVIVLGLLMNVTWAGTARPYHPETQIAQSIRGALARTPVLFMSVTELETVRDLETTEDGRTWLDDFNWNPHGVDADRFPYGVFTHPADRCLCWNRQDESLRETHFIIDWREREGFLTSADAALLREDLPPPPTEPEWCPVVLDLARPGA